VYSEKGVVYLNGRAFIQLLSNGKRPIVVFEERVEALEVVVDGGMRGRAIGFEERGDGEILINFDIKEFEKYNVEFMKPTWQDRNGVAKLTVLETEHYPKNGIESIYWNMDEAVPFQVVDELPLYAEYLSSDVQIPYVEWLEEKIQISPEEKMRKCIVIRLSETMQNNLQGSHQGQIDGMKVLIKALFGEDEMKIISSDALDYAIKAGM
jgi:hypothetical protein